VIIEDKVGKNSSFSKQCPSGHAVLLENHPAKSRIPPLITGEIHPSTAFITAFHAFPLKKHQAERGQPDNLRFSFDFPSRRKRHCHTMISEWL
jgi:hypothetical protein